MTGAAGTRIPENSPGEFACNTYMGGWMSEVHPTIPGQRAVVTICFHYGWFECNVSVNVTVINCGDYYVYDLPDVSEPQRYCGSHPPVYPWILKLNS